jgi:hypothetical protein
MLGNSTTYISQWGRETEKEREGGGLSTLSVKPYGSVYNYMILILPPILYIGGI